MKILLFASAFNGLSQRIHRELSLAGHDVSVELAISDEHLIEATRLYRPDLIICPFLKQRIPDEIWRKHFCLIVHPGVEGDRGPSSLDWAILNRETEWGVTVLQAGAEMDAGDIWASGTFSMRQTSKGSLYRREITRCSVRLIKQILEGFAKHTLQPRPLNYGDPSVRGIARPLMQQADRQIDWLNDGTEDVLRKINAADSAPGLLYRFLDEPVYLYGARVAQNLHGMPGSMIAEDNGAICLATVDGAVWVRMARRKSGPERGRIKLPAAEVLSKICRDNGYKHPVLRRVRGACNDIRIKENNAVAYVEFDFYNGAMGVDQCRQLLKAIKSVKKRSINVIVLMGGFEFWSNGIDLNRIEAATDPAAVSWANIQAMNDVVLEIIDSPKHLTVAALRNNAGAGGAIMPLACDRVVLRDGVILNPHYRSMGLYGSEYWTYLLPKRVGETIARTIARDCMPMLAREALLLGLGDELFDEDWAKYHQALQQHAELLAETKHFKELIELKRAGRKADESLKPLRQFAKEELTYMRESFFNVDSEYHQRRRQFVHKLAPQSTPSRLALHRMQEREVDIALPAGPFSDFAFAD